MDMDLDPQAYTNYPPAPSYHADHSVGEDDDDYPMMDTINFQSELDEELLFNLGVDDLSASEFLTRPEDPLDYYQASHMLILNKLPADIPNHSYQAMDGLVPYVGGSAEVTIYGNESAQTSRHWEYMGNPRPIHPGQSSGVCPTPTSRPWPTSQAGDSFVSTGNPWMGGPSPLHATVESEQPPAPSCDHINCYPPTDVGLLSRRFEENGNWIRARAAAVASLSHRRRGFYSLPIEIVEAIANQFPIINPLTSSGMADGLLNAYDRHTAFRTLSATSIRLKEIFYKHSWETRVSKPAELLALPTIFKELSAQGLAPHVERLITAVPHTHIDSLRECLIALPSLHTLEILDTNYIYTGVAKICFKQQPDFPNIRKVTMPLTAHPMLHRLPNVEELICFANASRPSVKPFLSSLRGPYAKERSGEVDPVLKSLTIIGTPQGGDFIDALVKKLPRLRKLCLPEPTAKDMAILCRLKEITELEILVPRNREDPMSYNIDKVKPLAIKILQESQCHKNCVCEYACRCTETGECRKCNPPGRFLRIKTCPTGRWVQGFTGAILDEGSCLKEIKVLPRRVQSN